MQALDAATPTLRELARDIGVSYHAIRLYRRGLRTPSPETRQALVTALRKRSAQLAAFADAIERAEKATP